MSSSISVAATAKSRSASSPEVAPEPLDVTVYSANYRQPDRTRHAWLAAKSPASMLTTVSGPEPIEFTSSGACHNFNLQLSAAPLVKRMAGGGEKTQLVAPGHVSLNVAEESFRCVVWPAANFLTLHVIIPPDWIAKVREQEVAGCGARGNGLTPLFGEWRPQVRDFALRLAEVVRFGNANDLLLDQLHLSLAVELIRVHHGGRTNPRAAGRMAVSKLHKVIEYVHEHVGNSFALADLADLADLSAFHFARSFKASVGVSPHRYVIELRLEKARCMLVATHQPITEIALSLGFDTPSHFCNTFRSRFGVTPSVFRLKNS